MKKALIILICILSLAFLFGCTEQPSSKTAPSILIFKLKSDYSENYLGPITYNEDSNTYDSAYTMDLFDHCYMASENNEIYDDITGEKVYDGKDNEKEVCFNMDSDEQLSKGGVKKLSNNYYAVIYPSVEDMVKRFAIFDKSIITKARSESDRVSIVPANFPTGIKPGMGNSLNLPKEEFYTYVLEEDPLNEAYFCNEPEVNLNAVATSLSIGEIPKTCKQII